CRGGSGFLRGNAVPDSTTPGVQKPHWSPWQSRNAACTGDNPPPGGPMPSIVVTSLPAACTANIKQARTAAPSTRTVQAPQTPCSQPRWVPVSRSSSRRKSARVRRGSTLASRGSPFTVSFTDTSAMVRLGGCRDPGARHHRGAHPLAVLRGSVEVAGDGVDPEQREPPDFFGLDARERPAQQSHL